MSPIEFIRRQLMTYFIIVTIVTLVIGILGLIYEPGQRFGYEAFFSPLLFGFIGVIPSVVTYSKKELSVKQVRIRMIIQLLVLEVMILSFGYIVGILKSEMIGSMILSIFAVFIAVNLFQWLLDNKKAIKLTRELKAYQNSRSNRQ
jgi:hypothetical protein